MRAVINRTPGASAANCPSGAGAALEGREYDDFVAQDDRRSALRRRRRPNKHTFGIASSRGFIGCNRERIPHNNERNPCNRERNPSNREQYSARLQRTE
jgi:hypothetical protein